MENIKIPDLPYVANPSDNATVVAVNNGSVVRIPKGSDTPGPGPTNPVPWTKVKEIEVPFTIIGDIPIPLYDMVGMEYEEDTLYIPIIKVSEELSEETEGLYDSLNGKLLLIYSSTGICLNENLDKKIYILFSSTESDYIHLAFLNDSFVQTSLSTPYFDILGGDIATGYLTVDGKSHASYEALYNQTIEKIDLPIGATINGSNIDFDTKATPIYELDLNGGESAS